MDFNFNLNEIRSKLQSNQNQQSNILYPSRIKEGETAIIRFLPYLGSDTGWFVEQLYHTLPGDRSKRYTCPKTFDKEAPCPFCEKANRYYQEGKDNLGSEFWRKRFYYANVILRNPEVVEDLADVEMPVVIRYGKTIQEKLVSGIQDDDIGLFFHPIDGFDFKLHHGTRKAGSNTYPDYTTSEFARRSSVAVGNKKLDEEAFKEMMNRAEDLKKMFPAPLSYEELKGVLDAGIVNPVTSSPFDNPASESTSSEPVQTTSSTSSESEKETTTTSSSSSDVEDEEIAALLAQIESNS